MEYCLGYDEFIGGSFESKMSQSWRTRVSSRGPDLTDLFLYEFWNLFQAISLFPREVSEEIKQNHLKPFLYANEMANGSGRGKGRHLRDGK